MVLAIAAVGCGPRIRTESVRTPDPRAVLRLERLAQQEMRCSAPLRFTSLELGAYQVDGCGQTREYAYVCAGRRCSFQPIVPAVLRASADLQCAPEQLQFAAQSATHRAFFGCSRGAAYMLVCAGRGCTWSRTPETVALATPSADAYVVPAPAPFADPSLLDVVIPPPPSTASPSTIAPPPSAAPEALVIPPPPS